MRIWLVALGSGKMTTENHNKFELYMAGQSGCTYSMQCSRDFENGGKARMHYNKRLLQLGPENE